MNETANIVVQQQRMAELETTLNDSKQKEEHLRMFLGTTTDWSWEVDATAVYTYVSPNIVNILGYTPQEIVGKTLFDLIPPDETERVQVLFEPNAQARQPNPLIEKVMLHREGHRLAIETSIVPFYHQDGSFGGYRGMARDITERKQHQDAMRESEERYRSLIENMLDGVFVIQDDKFIFVNEQLANIVDYPVEMMLQRSIVDVIAPEDQSWVLDRYRRRQQGENVTNHYEFRMLQRDGQTRVWVHTVVSLISYKGMTASMGTVRDITQHKQAEYERRLAQFTLDCAIDGVQWFTSAGKVVYVNNTTCTMLGYTREELLNMCNCSHS